MFDLTGGPGQPSNDRKELLRGAVVFAIGALDAFLHDLILELVPKFGQSSKELGEALKQIAREDPSLALRTSLAGTPEAAEEAFRDALDDWLTTKSFQGPEAVMRATAYIGRPLTWEQLNGLTQKNAAAELQRFTQMRHSIVHRGSRPYVRRRIAQECVDLVSNIARETNSEAVKLYH
jgi:hypothetical protein